MPTDHQPWPVQQFGKWGYVDAHGVMVIAARFSSARGFAEGLAAVREGQLWGYIDASGMTVIAPAFDDAGNFHEGRAVCRKPRVQAGAVDRADLGVIDREGRWVVAPVWRRVAWRGEWWEVEDAERRTGWLDARGEVLVAPRFRSVQPSPLEVAAGENGGRWFVVDLRAGGRVSEACGVDEVRWPDQDACFPARRGDRWGWIGPDGAWVVAPAWHKVEAFVGDRAPVTDDDGRVGLVDRAGRVVIPVEHARLSTARRGLWWQGDGEEVWLVDADGARRGGPWLDWSSAAPEALLFVRDKEGWGALSAEGLTLVVEPRWDAIGDAGEGLVRVCRGDRWGIVDPALGLDAPPIIAVEHETMDAFYGGLVALHEGRQLVDRQGRTVWRRPPPGVPCIPSYVHRAPDWARVVDALPRLRADTSRGVFGAWGSWGQHQYAIGPVLAEEELAALEAEHGVQLPADLRSFLATVGNGPGVPPTPSPKGFVTRGGAGPGYGVYDVRRSLAGNGRASSPFVPLRARADVEAAVDTEDDYAPPGLVILGTHGCAYDWAVVVTGPWAGTEWTYVDPGWIPSTPAFGEILVAHHNDYAEAHDWLRAHLEEVPIRTFADLYMEWLDAALNA